MRQQSWQNAAFLTKAPTCRLQSDKPKTLNRLSPVGRIGFQRMGIRDEHRNIGRRRGYCMDGNCDYCNRRGDLSGIFCVSRFPRC